MTEKKTNLPAATKLAGFLEKVKTTPPPQKRASGLATARAGGPARLVVGMDATASREPSWRTAKEVMGGMFAEVPQGLSVSLAYYGGSHGFRATPFVDDVTPLIAEANRVYCSAGHTQIVRMLDHVAGEISRGGRVAGLVLVGDAFEEDLATAVAGARRLRLLGCPVFAFFEGDNRTGKAAYEKIAAMSGGAFLPFDSSAPAMLRELLAGIAAYAHGGLPALEAATKRLPAARLLLTQMKPKDA